MRFAVFLLAIACSSKGPKDPAFTPAGPKPCEKMADHVVGVLLPKDPKNMNEQQREVTDKLTRLLIDRCTKDTWTVDAQRCWLEFKSGADLDKCTPLMTVDQRDNLAKEIDVVFPKSPGTGSGSGSGTGEP